MNLLQAGRARSFLPVVRMSRAGVTVIRPLVLSTEAAIIDEVRRLGLPVLETVCPFAGRTERARVRGFIKALRSGEGGLAVPDLYAKVVNALENLSDGDAWGGCPSNEEGC